MPPNDRGQPTPDVPETDDVDEGHEDLARVLEDAE